ncbi:hypothetical protein [Lyngbya aestuarii]
MSNSFSVETFRVFTARRTVITLSLMSIIS